MQVKVECHALPLHRALPWKDISVYYKQPSAGQHTTQELVGIHNDSASKSWLKYLQYPVNTTYNSIAAKWCKIKCDNKIVQVFFILISREPSVNKIDLQALTLVGPTRSNLVLDP